MIYSKLPSAYLLTAAILWGFGFQPTAVWGDPAAALIAGFPSRMQTYSLSCEYAAVVAVMRYYGRVVTEETFMNEVPRNENPHLGFRGDIRGTWGGITDYGVYAEPLVAVLARQTYRAVVFYGPVRRLKAELAAGRPVVVWFTGKRGPLPRTYIALAGTTFSITPWEHTAVAYGYDATGVRIMDVGNGQRYFYSWSSFTTRWNYFDQMALVITPGWK